MAGASPLDALRAATQDAHRRLDASPVAARLLAADAGANDYRTYLAAVLAGHLAIEPRIGRDAGPALLRECGWNPVAALAAEDLAALGAHVPEPPPGTASLRPAGAPAEPTADARCAALGALYVLQGSRLGASWLLARLRRGPLSSGLGCAGRFLGAQAASAGASWAATRAVLARELQPPGALAAAIDGAHGAFDAFERAFAQAGGAGAPGPSQAASTRGASASAHSA